MTASRTRWTVLAVALALSACGGGSDGGERAAAPEAEHAEPGLVHVHGLGINPADGALFIATHTGMWRSAEGTTTATRVGERKQDTMGFTVVGPDHFLGSGHPDLRDDLPPHLGLIESRDAGRTWEPVSLLGEADFHVLRAGGRRVYGYDSTNARLRVSDDGGRTWRDRPTLSPVLDLALDPRRPARLVATTDGDLFRSTDYGRGWRRLHADPGLLGWPVTDALYRVTGDGTVSVSADAGSTWREVGSVGGGPASFLAHTRDELYVALHDGPIKVSHDGGRTWSVRVPS